MSLTGHIIMHVNREIDLEINRMSELLRVCEIKRSEMIFCTIESKPLALPWGRTPRLDSSVRWPEWVPCRARFRDNRVNRCGCFPRTDRPIGGSVDGSSITGSADGLLGSGLGPCEIGFYYGPLLIGALEKDLAPHLTARQEQTVQVLSANKAPFWRYPECFLVLVGLSLYYPFDENTYPAFERPDKTDMGLLDYIRTADPRKVQTVEVQKGEEQVKLLDSIKHCFVSLDTPAVVQQEGCSGSGAGPEVSAPSTEENDVAEENVIPVGTYLDLMDPKGDLTVAEKGDAARRQPDKVKRKKLSKQSDTLPAKKLRVDHPSLASGTGGKSLASLRQTIPEGSLALGPSFQADIHALVTMQGSHVVDAPVYTAADTVTSSRGKTHAASTSDMGGSSQLETSEGSADSFYETAALNSEDAK
ncbi:hypothetical protein Tco_0492501, partial [Tanacetum coccineum]